MSAILWESDLRALGPSWQCCGSCHDDADLGYAPFPAKLGPGDAELHGCCETPDPTDEQWAEMLRRAVR